MSVACELNQLHQSVIFSLKDERLTRAEFEYCVQVLNRGGIIVMPTDTVYGIVCHPFNPEAIKKIYELKGRDYKKPLPILLGNLNHLPLVAEQVLPEAYQLMKKFWPGGMTLVFETAKQALFATAGRDSIAVRFPDYKFNLDLISAFELPLAATSANRSGEESIVQSQAAIDLFRGRVDVIIDGGTCPKLRESSVVDVRRYPFSLIREGAISKKELMDGLGLK
ncbi:MAG: L-threonylcarbamoyladenylate synthase [Elusimicrobiota bacterium]